MQEDNARDYSKIEITLLKVITYWLQNYSEELEAGSVHAYKLILGLVEAGICRQPILIQSFQHMNAWIYLREGWAN